MSAKINDFTVVNSDSKVTNFATLIFRKIKEIELNLSTRFEDIEFNCGLLSYYGLKNLGS